MPDFPTPKVGMVISYSYLWQHEYLTGKIEGRKQRPCAVVFIVETQDKKTRVMVAPITHRQPENTETAIEIPPAIKQYLKLDYEKSWLILNDFNVFEWPGYDVHPIDRKKNICHYGFLPPKFLHIIQKRAKELGQQKRIWVSGRDD